MTNTKPFNRYKVETFQRLVTTAQVIDRETQEVVAEGSTVLSPNDTNDQKLGREIATGRAFKQFLQNERITNADDAEAKASEIYEEGLEVGFRSGRSQQSSLDYFLEGVRVGHSQHPQISEFYKACEAFQGPPIALPAAPEPPQVVLNPSPCGPYTKLSYEPGDRVLHVNDTKNVIGVVVSKKSTDPHSICNDRYNIVWPLAWGPVVLDYPVEYLKSAPSV